MMVEHHQCDESKELLKHLEYDLDIFPEDIYIYKSDDGFWRMEIASSSHIFVRFCPFCGIKFE